MIIHYQNHCRAEVRIYTPNKRCVFICILIIDYHMQLLFSVLAGHIVEQAIYKSFLFHFHPSPGHRHIYAPFDAAVICGTFCTLLAPNVVWSLIQGLQICKLRSYRLCKSYGPLEATVNLFVEKQVTLPATPPDIECEILCCKDILFAKIT